MHRADSAHWLKPAGRCTTPAAVIVLDSETRTTDPDGDEAEVLRWWDARCTWRRDPRRGGETWRAAGSDPAEAAAAVDAWASYGKSTWLYAHNVAFDLVVTGLAQQLAGLGWELSSRFGISGQGMWCVLHKGRRMSADHQRPGPGGVPGIKARWDHTLTIADSASLFPAALADLDLYTGIVKPAVDFRTATDAEIEARCRADVDITAALVLALMDWWDQAGTGGWQVTGAGLGWQTYRATLAPRQVVIDHDPAIIAWERQAVYGGRRDIFRWGPLPGGRHGEIDFEAAYPQVAASFPLPAKAACPVTDAHRAMAMAGKVPAGMLAEVTIVTSQARWPVRMCGRVFYPVGRFKTILAAPDIQAAADAGALEAVHDGWLYVLTGHLRPWARQVLAWAKGSADESCPVLKVAAKLWSRAVIGKFAQPGWSTRPWVGPPTDGWAVEPIIGLYNGIKGTLTALAGQWWWSQADQRGEHERPAVLAFVEAHVRCRLGVILAGPYGQAVMQCDTDGLMADLGQLAGLAAGAGSRWRKGRRVPFTADDVIAAWNEAAWPLVMRQKQLHRRVVLHGPQHLVLDGKPRAAGLPRGAWQGDAGEWFARLWPGLAWQAAHGPPEGYGRPVRKFVMAGPYCAGWPLAGGAVRPVEAAIDEQGYSYPLAWPLTRWAAAGDLLGPVLPAWADTLEGVSGSELSAVPG
jgi:hypothetical protein